MLIVRTLRGLIEIDRPEETWFPDADICKGEVVDYYLRSAGLLVPYLRQRELLIECQDGSVIRRGPCLDSSTLVNLVNQGAVAFRTETCGPSSSNQLIFDLDPLTDSAGPAVIDVAWELRSLLGELGLRSLVASTGAGGLQIVVPLAAPEPLDSVWTFAQDVAATLWSRRPAQSATGAVALDLSSNAPGQTRSAPFSIRLAPEAPVVLPLGWDQVRGGEVLTANVHSFGRLGVKEDPWRGWTFYRRPLEPARQRLASLQDTRDSLLAG